MQSTFQVHLDVQMQYDLTAPICQGEYVIPQYVIPIPPFGQADQAVGAHVHRNTMHLRMQSKPTRSEPIYFYWGPKKNLATHQS